MLEDLPEALPLAAATGSFIAGLVGSLSIRRARHLEGKLAALRRQLLTQAGMLVVFAVSVALAARRDGHPAAAGAASDPATIAHVYGLAKTFERQLREGDGWVAYLALLLLAAVPSLLHVLRELQTFVLHHRTDLLARDQAAATMQGTRAGQA